AGGTEATRCADQPYQATFEVLDEKGSVVTTFRTDDNGRFEVALSPGTYTLAPETNPNAVLPRASTQTVTVTEGQFTQITINFDTGIR
ncbi:MAG TPA: SpaA isopeptide-forming pilin-related protein, partial [Anaerolineales bacterium]|nr:SpaA isopeptide-forming pilin-related protein [Anaerolineales bacterium]